MMRRIWLTCLFLVVAASISCGKKPDATERDATERDAADAPAKQPADEGIVESAGKTVDYFTGKTHLDAKKRAESQLEKIQADRNRQIEEALAE